jgi:hypothetical protein
MCTGLQLYWLLQIVQLFNKRRGDCLLNPTRNRFRLAGFIPNKLFFIQHKLTLPNLFHSNLIPRQGDQIGRNFAIWAIFYGIGRIFFYKKSPNHLGKILAMKKLPKIDLNKAKILFQKRFFLHVFQKYSKNFISFLM